MPKLREEAIKFIRVPKNLVFLLIGPIIFAVIFGFVYYNDYLNDITVGVYDLDHSATSRMIIQTFDDSDRFEVTETPSTQQDLKNLMDSRRIHLGVFIPKGFEQDIKRGRDTGALLLVDGANIAIGNNALATAGEVLNTLNAGVSIKVFEGKGANPDSSENLAKLFQIQGRVLYDSKMSYKYYVLPGLIMMVVQQLFLAIFVPNFVEDPINPLQKAVICIGTVMLSYSASLIFLENVIGVHFAGSKLLAIALVTLYLFCLMGSAMTLSAIFRNRMIATQLCMMLSLPTFLLAGYVWPVSQMPPVLTFAVKLMWPLIHMLCPVRDILVKATPLHMFYGNIATLLVFGAVWFIIGSKLVKIRLGGVMEAKSKANPARIAPETV